MEDAARGGRSVGRGNMACWLLSFLDTAWTRDAMTVRERKVVYGPASPDWAYWCMIKYPI